MRRTGAHECATWAVSGAGCVASILCMTDCESDALVALALPVLRDTYASCYRHRQRAKDPFWLGVAVDFVEWLADLAVMRPGAQEGGRKARDLHHGGGIQLTPADAVITAAAAGNLVSQEDRVTCGIHTVGVGFNDAIMVVIADLKQGARLDGAADDVVVFQGRSPPGSVNT